MTTDPNELGLCNVHSPKACVGQTACPMHKPSQHHMRHWRVIWRDDRGILERLCPEHSIGHPDPDQIEYWRDTGQEWQEIHGCCGCCRL
ncbi:hypothetical protein [Nocardia asiatica]|uniref:hypothetical protein n=1 Tax=Nocardia asiatica TaxID=209252 RepID=UPI0024569548|nr:hypothetical protein [Nocardia asiatica]